MSSENRQTVTHLSEDVFEAGNLPLRTSHILMQDLEASDDDDDSPVGLSPVEVRDISDDEVKDEDFIPV